MLSKLSLLVKSKVALAAVGTVLVAGGGAAALAASGHLPATSNQSAASTHTPEATKAADHGHGHTVSIEGTLKGYNGGASTISVLGSHDSAATTICVDGKTEVNGDHASKVSDLAAAIGHKVQVQATKQSSGSCALLAWKVTVQGADGDNGGDGTGGDGHQGQQKTIDGSVTSVGSASFVVKLRDGTTETVTVSGQTRFAGRVHGLADLKSGDKVAVIGTDQGGGVIAATAVVVTGGD